MPLAIFKLDFWRLIHYNFSTMLLNSRELARKKREMLKLFYARNFVKALQLYEEILVYIESDAEMRKIGGDLYLAVGNTSLALGEYRKALQLWMEGANYERARVLAQKIAHLAPDDLDIHSTVAEIYLKKGDTKRAVLEMSKYVDKALAQGKKDLAKFMLERIRRRGLTEYLPDRLKQLLGINQDIEKYFEEVKLEPEYKHFNVYLRKEIARGNRYNRNFSLILIHRNREKAFDTLEKNTIREILTEALREADIFFIGDKWLFVLLPETNKYGAMHVYDRLKEVLGEQFLDLRFFLANFPDDGLSDSELIKKALTYQEI